MQPNAKKMSNIQMCMQLAIDCCMEIKFGNSSFTDETYNCKPSVFHCVMAMIKALIMILHGYKHSLQAFHYIDHRNER